MSEASEQADSDAAGGRQRRATWAGTVCVGAIGVILAALLATDAAAYFAGRKLSIGLMAWGQLAQYAAWVLVIILLLFHASRGVRGGQLAIVLSVLGLLLAVLPLTFVLGKPPAQRFAEGAADRFRATGELTAVRTDIATMGLSVPPGTERQLAPALWPPSVRALSPLHVQVTPDTVHLMMGGGLAPWGIVVHTSPAATTTRPAHAVPVAPGQWVGY